MIQLVPELVKSGRSRNSCSPEGAGQRRAGLPAAALAREQPRPARQSTGGVVNSSPVAGAGPSVATVSAGCSSKSDAANASWIANASMPDQRRNHALVKELRKLCGTERVFALASCTSSFDLLIDRRCMLLLEGPRTSRSLTGGEPPGAGAPARGFQAP